MKLLLLYPPFCTPTVMSYSLAYMKAFLQDNLKMEVKCLDLNAKFHHLRFKPSYEKLKKSKDSNEYFSILEEFDTLSRPIYSENNKKVIHDQLPELFEEILNLILEEKADFIAFSLVYNSQCFYAKPLIEELLKRKQKVLLGGPADYSRINKGTNCLKNEVELLEYLAKGSKQKISSELNCSTVPDFSDFKDVDYLTKEIVLPLKSSTACYYQQCAFCTHHGNRKYFKIDLGLLKKGILQTKKKHFFFIDDMISKERLVKIATMLKLLKVKWWCQLRPTRELIALLPEMYASGLRSVSWGVESASQRVLDFIKKGTKVPDIAAVLKASHEAGIKNSVYIMFGFPTETKEEFMQTLQFLRDNRENIDLVTTSIFGLQKGSKVYAEQEKYAIKEIITKPRTILDDIISYRASSGMQPEEVAKAFKRHLYVIKKIDKLPRVINYFKEQVLLV